VTALSNVSLVKDNLEKHVEDSILYPYLKKAGSYLINLDPSTLGLTSTSTTQVVKEVINLNEDNTTETPTKTVEEVIETNASMSTDIENNQSALSQ
jgi:hypothetical protein